MAFLLVAVGNRDVFFADLADAVSAGRLVPDRHPGIAELDELIDRHPNFVTLSQAAGYNRASFLAAVRGDDSTRGALVAAYRAAAELNLNYTPDEAQAAVVRLGRLIINADRGWEVDRWRSPVNGSRWILHHVAEPSDLAGNGGHETWSSKTDGVRVLRAGGTGAFNTWLSTVQTKYDNRATDPDWVNWGTDVLQVIPIVEDMVTNGDWELLRPNTDIPRP